MLIGGGIDEYMWLFEKLLPFSSLGGEVLGCSTTRLWFLIFSSRRHFALRFENQTY